MRKLLRLAVCCAMASITFPIDADRDVENSDSKWKDSARERGNRDHDRENKNHGRGNKDHGRGNKDHDRGESPPDRDDDIAATPEPSSILLLGTVLAGTIFVGRKLRRKDF